ncbi:hypothetical protein SAZ11_19650 [Streptomyces sp. FXJ1.4098]|nr:hypothetical protein [Streptomyces sp. FXJ1.4098]
MSGFRRRRRRGLVNGQVEGWVTAEDALVKCAEVWARVDAEFVGEVLAYLVEALKGVGRSACAIERQDELTGDPFVQRICLSPSKQSSQNSVVLTHA